MLPARQSPGHLAENVMHFARVLRSAGMAVGTDRVQLTLQALKFAGPCPVQAAGRFDRDHLLASVRREHLLQCRDPGPRNR